MHGDALLLSETGEFLKRRCIRCFHADFFLPSCQPRLDVLRVTHPRSEKGLNGGMTYLSGNFSLPHLERLIHDAHQLHRTLNRSRGGGGCRDSVEKRAKSHPFTSQCVQVPQERVHRSPRPQNAEDGHRPCWDFSVAGVGDQR